MNTPEVQRLGDAILLQPPVVAEVNYLVRLGLRYRERVHGTAPSAHHRRLLEALADTAEATFAHDVRGGTDQSQLISVVGTEEAARFLGLTERQTRRLAPHLGGQLVKGAWKFDRAAVLAAAHRRNTRRNAHDE